MPVERELGRHEPFFQLSEEPADTRRGHHADRVADHRTVRSGVRARVVQVHDEVQVRAERVLRDERDVDAVGDRVLRLSDCDFFHLLPRHPELMPDVQIGPSGEERDLIDPAIDARVDIFPNGPSGRHDRGVEPRVRDRTDAPGFLLRDDRNPDVHDRNVDLIEEPCDLDLLLGRVCDTWSLFSVSQGLLPNAHPLGDPAREARFNQVVVDEAFLRDGRSP